MIVKDWSHFSDLAGKITLPQQYYGDYVFRGQANDSWRLEPSLLRYLPRNVTPQAALELEDKGFDEFSSQAHLHLPNEVLPVMLGQPSLMEWWAIMQHYHAPTRLLDWTQSPYVAAYYAIEKEAKKPGAIFVVHTKTILRSFKKHFPKGNADNEQLRDPNAPATLEFFRPQKRTYRLVAQQGCFSLSANILGMHDDLIAEQCKEASLKAPKTLFFEKWIIPSRLKLNFLQKLRAMNIAAHSLFPGIDGLGLSLVEAARLLTTFTKAST